MPHLLLSLHFDVVDSPCVHSSLSRMLCSCLSWYVLPLNFFILCVFLRCLCVVKLTAADDQVCGLAEMQTFRTIRCKCLRVETLTPPPRKKLPCLLRIPRRLSLSRWAKQNFHFCSSVSRFICVLLPQACSRVAPTIQRYKSPFSSVSALGINADELVW